MLSILIRIDRDLRRPLRMCIPKVGAARSSRAWLSRRVSQPMDQTSSATRWTGWQPVNSLVVLSYQT